MKKYPKIGEIHKVTPQGLCVLCGKAKADKRVEVEHDYFRGNDTVHKVHSKCAENAGKRLLELLL